MVQLLPVVVTQLTLEAALPLIQVTLNFVPVGFLSLLGYLVVHWVYEVLAVVGVVLLRGVLVRLVSKQLQRLRQCLQVENLLQFQRLPWMCPPHQMFR